MCCPHHVLKTMINTSNTSISNAIVTVEPTINTQKYSKSAFLYIARTRGNDNHLPFPFTPLATRSSLLRAPPSLLCVPSRSVSSSWSNPWCSSSSVLIATERVCCRLREVDRCESWLSWSGTGCKEQRTQHRRTENDTQDSDLPSIICFCVCSIILGWYPPCASGSSV